MVNNQNIVVVIPTFGRSLLLERTLASLALCKFPSQYLKTIVIENGTKGQAESVCERYSHISCEYQYSAVANKSKALNKALATIRDNTFIIFLDDDIRLSPDTLIAYSEAFKKFGKDFFFGGPFEVDYEKKPHSSYIGYLPLSAQGWQKKDNITLLPNHLIGFNWAVHKTHLLTLGEFNPRFGPNSTTGAVGQEHDMMNRLSNMGIKPLYVHDALVWHYVPVKRSTLWWALGRKYKGGISEGIRNLRWDLKTVSSKFPSLLSGLLTSMIKFRMAGIVHYLFEIQFYRGIKKGIKMR